MNLNREQLEDTCNAYGMDISMEHSTRTLDTQYRQYDIYGVYESSRVKIEMPFNLFQSLAIDAKHGREMRSEADIRQRNKSVEAAYYHYKTLLALAL